MSAVVDDMFTICLMSPAATVATDELEFQFKILCMTGIYLKFKIKIGFGGTLVFMYSLCSEVAIAALQCGLFFGRGTSYAFIESMQSVRYDK